MAFRQSEDDAQASATPVTKHHANVAEIIPSLPLETGWPPFRLRHYAGFWLPEAKALKIGIPAVHSSFKPRPTDMFLASFPKSGATWLKALAFATLKRSTHPPCDEDHPLRRCSPHDIVRFIEMEFNTRDEFELLPSPRMLATHLPYSLLPNCITGEHSGCRIVYICREPKDALVSLWLFIRMLAPTRGIDVQSFTIQEAFELFCQGRCPDGPQWRHVLQYWEESVRRPNKVLFLQYEEMLFDPETHVKKLAKFMGCEFSKEEEESGVVSSIVDLCSLGKLRDMEVNRNGNIRLGAKNESFFRKGVVGDWSNHMTPEMAQRLDKVVEDALQGTGFTFSSTMLQQATGRDTPLVTSRLRFANRTMASRDTENNAQEGATPLTTPHTNIARIIPSLPLETRWPTLSVRHYASFWLAEVTLKAGVPLVHSCFEPGPTDVFLASFPKSGTTWLKALVFATLKRCTHVPFDRDHPLRHCSPHDIVRFIEIEFNTRDEFEVLPSPRVLATHLPYSLLPNCITGEHSGCRIVYICREPKDTLISYWLFTRRLAPGVDFTIQEALELFCEGHCPGGPQWQHVLQYWEESVRRPDRVLFLRYDLRGDAT